MFSLGPTIYQEDDLLKMRKRIDSSPPMWGEYSNATAFYASQEWLDIVRSTLDNHRITLGLARRAGNAAAITFYSNQIKACEQQLGLTPAQQNLFDSLLPR